MKTKIAPFNCYPQINRDLSRQAELGFSVFELLVVVAASALFFATALPNQGALNNSFDRGVSLKQVDADLRRARAEAMAEGVRVVVEFANDGGSYQVGFDIAPYANPAVIDEVSFSTVLPDQVTVISPKLIFDPRGYSIAADGALRTVTLTMSHKGSSYASGAVSPAGFLDY